MITRINRIAFACLLLPAIWPGPVAARGITIDSLQSSPLDNHYVLNARISYNFSQEVLKALEHGVALYFNVEIKTRLKRKFLWDKTVASDMLHYRLEYHPLSQRYLVTEYKRSQKDDFTTLDGALGSMGRITDYPYADIDQFTAGKNYHTIVKVELDSKSLPAPLRPLSYISTDWQLSSAEKHVALTP